MEKEQKKLIMRVKWFWSRSVCGTELVKMIMDQGFKIEREREREFIKFGLLKVNFFIDFDTIVMGELFCGWSLKKFNSAANSWGLPS